MYYRLIYIFSPFLFLTYIALLYAGNFEHKYLVFSLFIILGIIGFTILIDRIESSLLIVYSIIAMGLCNYSVIPLNINIIKLSYFLFAALYLILFLKTFSFKEFDRVFRFNFSLRNILVFLFVVSFFYSVVIINYRDILTIDGFLKIFIFISAAYFTCVYLPRFFFNDINKFFSFVSVIAYIGVFSAFLGFLTIFLPLNPLSYKFPGIALSYFNHPNAPPFLYVVTLPCILYLFFFERKILSAGMRKLMLFGAVITCINILFTYSRAGILAMFVIILILLFFYSKKFFFVFLFFTASFYVVLMGFLSSKGLASSITRFQLIYIAITILQASSQNLLWGVGTTSIFPIFEEVRLSMSILDPNNYPHNVILFYLLQFGLVSAIPLFLLFIKTLFSTIYKIIVKRPNYKLKILCLTVCIGVLTQGLLEDKMLFPEYFLFHIFLIFVGMLIALDRTKLELKEVDKFRRSY